MQPDPVGGRAAGCIKFASRNLRNFTRLRLATARQEVETQKLEV
jgi:hypothetical protein